MKNENKNPVWVTIPEKKAEKIFSDKKISNHPDKVNNKIFWGAGFVALAIFSFMLMMPGKFSELFQGDLFDGEFKIIPDSEDQEGGAFFGNTGTDQVVTEETAEQIPAQNQPSGISENTSDAVPIQVDPSTSQTQIPAQETEQVPLTEEPTVDQTDAVMSSELQATLENLNAQLEALKQDGLKKDQEIQSLSEMLEQQVIHNSAKPEPEVTESAQSTAANSQAQTTQNIGVYKPNTHTVQLNPQQILANTTNPTQIKAQTFQANVNQNFAVSQNMNTALSGVNSQPATGPLESLMFAFLLSSFAVLGFGIYRTIKI